VARAPIRIQELNQMKIVGFNQMRDLIEFTAPVQLTIEAIE
jgi:hypothetical protein